MEFAPAWADTFHPATPSGSADESASAVTFDADDRTAATPGGEERGLGSEVLVEGIVEVEVILGEVSEAGHVEAHRIGAPLGQGVRRGLDDQVRAAAGDEVREQALKVGRHRGGHRGGDLMPRQPQADRADQAGNASQLGQDVFQQEGGGGLAVRARDRECAELIRRISVDMSRDLAQPAGDVGNHEKRGVHTGQALDDRGALRIGHHGRGSCQDGTRGEPGPVYMLPRDGGEQDAGGDPSRIGGYSADGGAPNALSIDQLC